MKNLHKKPINHATLIQLGYNHHIGDYYCPPPPARCDTYRLELKATQHEGLNPIKGTETWRAFLTDENLKTIRRFTIRRFKNLGELNYFHKGMCGEWLFEINYEKDI